MSDTIRICHLYPDILNLYGDYGNVLCIQKRLLWRNINCIIENVTVKDKLYPENYDIFFIGGGQDFEQEILLEDLLVNKKELIKKAVDDNKTFLAICGGYQLLGKYYKTWDGQNLEFVGALDIHTIGQKKRMIGDYKFTCQDDDGYFEVIAFENHSGKTYLSKSVNSLGQITKGNGNNGEDNTEGARYKNVFCSYGHGPLLPKNPRLADLIISTFMKQRIKDFKLSKLDDSIENLARNNMIERVRFHSQR